MTGKELESKIFALEEKIKKLEEYDELTGLFKKKRFCEIAQERISGDGNFNLICVDIERFKVVNDICGQQEGDNLLKFAAERLNELAEEADGFAARITADVFAMLIKIKENITTSDIENKIGKIFKNYPLILDINTATGIYEITDKTLPVSIMCDRAIIALNSIKGNYLKHFALYEPNMRETLIEEQMLLSAAKKALENGEFKVYIQPKCNIKTGKIVGSEALVRWLHPDLGLIPPAKFINVFEKCGFISELDKYVWEQVCILLKSFMNAGIKLVPISVNVSRIDLYELDLCTMFVNLMGKYQIDRRFFELEITESAYCENFDKMNAVVSDLMKNNFTVLMDDFGSGYSSLNMLKDIKTDILKIDMRFLEDCNSPKTRGNNIVESVVKLAKWLNMRVIAEGVETKEQADFLLSIDCNYAQGYYFYKAMKIDDYKALLQDTHNVEYGGIAQIVSTNIDFHDLFQSNTMSEMLLNNLLGAVVLYKVKDKKIESKRVNEEYYRITGDKRGQEFKSKRISTLANEEDLPTIYNAMEQAKKNPLKGNELEFRRLREDGSYMWMRMRVFFLSENGGYEMYYASILDITKQKQSEEKLRKSETLYRVAMISTNLIPFEFDIKNKRIYRDSSYESLYGIDDYVENVPDSLINSEIVHPDCRDICVKFFNDMIEGKPKSVVEGQMKLKSGEYVWQRATMTNIFDNNAKPVKAFGVIENISREKELERKVLQNAKTLESLKKNNKKIADNLINEIMPGAILGGYLEKDFPLYVINRDMLQLLGCENYDEFVNYTQARVINTISVNDRKRVINELKKLKTFGEQYTIEYNMVRKDGSQFCVLERGKIVEAEDGRRAIISVCLNNDERKNIEKIIEIYDKSLKILSKLSNMEIWAYNFKTRRLTQTKGYQKNFEWAETIEDAPEAVINMNVIQPNSIKCYLNLFQEIEKGAEKSSAKVSIKCKDGNYHNFRIYANILRVENGKPVNMLGVYENIDEEIANSKKIKNLSRAAKRDFLTGLLNRAAFEDACISFLKDFSEKDKNAALVLIDVDDYKKINDMFGHLKGDEILRCVANVIENSFKDNCIICRIGGDEFAVLVPFAHNESVVCNYAEKFLQNIKKESSKKNVIVTASVGISFIKVDENEFVKVYKKADLALYHSKKLGKNTYSVYKNNINNEIPEN